MYKLYIDGNEIQNTIFDIEIIKKRDEKNIAFWHYEFNGTISIYGSDYDNYVEYLGGSELTGTIQENYNGTLYEYPIKLIFLNSYNPKTKILKANISSNNIIDKFLQIYDKQYFINDLDISPNYIVQRVDNRSLYYYFYNIIEIIEAIFEKENLDLNIINNVSNQLDLSNVHYAQDNTIINIYDYEERQNFSFNLKNILENIVELYSTFFYIDIHNNRFFFVDDISYDDSLNLSIYDNVNNSNLLLDNKPKTMLFEPINTHHWDIYHAKNINFNFISQTKKDIQQKINVIYHSLSSLLEYKSTHNLIYATPLTERLDFNYFFDNSLVNAFFNEEHNATYNNALTTNADNYSVTFTTNEETNFSSRKIYLFNGTNISIYFDYDNWGDMGGNGGLARIVDGEIDIIKETNFYGNSGSTSVSATIEEDDFYFMYFYDIDSLTTEQKKITNFRISTSEGYDFYPTERYILTIDNLLNNYKKEMPFTKGYLNSGEELTFEKKNDIHKEMIVKINNSLYDFSINTGIELDDDDDTWRIDQIKRKIKKSTKFADKIKLSKK